MKLPLMIGFPIGDLVYPVIRHGLAAVDWYHVGFFAIFGAILVGLLPRRWFERDVN